MKQAPEEFKENDDWEVFRGAMKQQYEQADIYGDLLKHGSQLLKKGGRIVFLWHTDDEQPAEKNKFPEHPDFEFVRSSRD